MAGSEIPQFNQKPTKRPPPQPIIDAGDRQLERRITEKAQDIHSARTEQLALLKDEVTTSTERKENLATWGKILIDPQNLEKITGGEKNINFPYQGSSVSIELNETFQILSIKEQRTGRKYLFKNGLNPEKFSDALSSIQEIPAIIAEKMKIGLPQNFTFNAEGPFKFSFQLENSDKTTSTYMIFADKKGIMGRVYKYEKTIVDEKSGQTKRVFSTIDGKTSMEEISTDDENFQLTFYDKTESPLPDSKPADQDFLGIQKTDPNPPSEVRQYKNGEVQKITDKNDTLEYTYLKNGQFLIIKIPIKKPQITHSTLNEKMITISSKYLSSSITLYSHEGRPLEEHHLNHQGKILKHLKRSYADNFSEVTSYSKSGAPLITMTATENPKKNTSHGNVFFHTKDGGTFSDYVSESKKNPRLTHEGYIAKLAEILNTPEDWQNFINIFFKYETDTPDMNDPTAIGKIETTEDYFQNPLAMVTRSKYEFKDYFQTPAETISRVDTKTGQMQGDCEDLAFLVQAILQKKGIKSEVILMPSHAICAYIIKQLNGKYDIYTIDTAGFQENGKFHHEMHEEINGKFKTPEEAMNFMYDDFEVKNPDFRIKGGLIDTLGFNPNKKVPHDSIHRAGSFIHNKKFTSLINEKSQQ